MKLPVELQRTLHKHGGQIIRVTGMAYEANKPSDGYSRDTWWFVGDVNWNDGTMSDGLEIAPWCLCADEGDKEPEVRELCELMSDYLNEHGQWCGPESKHRGWYANKRPEAKVRRRA